MQKSAPKFGLWEKRCHDISIYKWGEPLYRFFISKIRFMYISIRVDEHYAWENNALRVDQA